MLLMLKSVLKQRVNIQFCILNESSATFSVGISSCLPVTRPESGLRVSTLTYTHTKSFFHPNLTDVGSNCSNCPSGRPQLFAEPCVCRFSSESRMPRHEIWTMKYGKDLISRGAPRGQLAYREKKQQQRREN